MTDPNAERPLEAPTDERTADPTEADTIKRQNADELLVSLATVPRAVHRPGVRSPTGHTAAGNRHFRAIAAVGDTIRSVA